VLKVAVAIELSLAPEKARGKKEEGYKEGLSIQQNIQWLYSAGPLRLPFSMTLSALKAKAEKYPLPQGMLSVSTMY